MRDLRDLDAAGLPEDGGHVGRGGQALPLKRREGRAHLRPGQRLGRLLDVGMCGSRIEGVWLVLGCRRKVNLVGVIV